MAAVRTGDRIELSVKNRSLTLKVEERELERRLSEWRPAPPKFTRGYGSLFLDHVLQAEQGCDFDFLRGSSGPAVAG